jgi:hypothetical protein
MVADGVAREFAELCVEATSYKRLAFAAATKTTYRCQLNAYLRFCIYYERVPCPADKTTLKAYIAFLARSLKSSSIPCYLNIVRIVHVSAGFTNPFLENWDVSMVRRGVMRVKGQPPVQKMPMTLPILRLISGFLDFSLPGDIAFWAACLVCFFGLLRKGTLLPRSRLELANCLLRSDVVMKCDSFVLHIRHTKTVQFGQRVIVIPFVACLDPLICPVRNLLIHLTRSVLPPTAALFDFVVGSRIVCITHTSFVVKLRCLLTRCGFDSGKYSGHSFRRGGCTLCFRAGLSLIEIKRRGDWRSQVFERYIHVPTDAIFRSACILAQFADTS